MTSPYLTVEEVAMLLRITPRTVRNRISKKNDSMPPSKLLNGRRMFSKEEFQAWCCSSKAKAQKENEDGE